MTQPWGDVADLVDLLDVRRQDDGSFVSVTRPGGARSVVEGSQLLGQAVVAAGRRVPDRRMVSGHLVFVRPADTETPVTIQLDEVSAGRTFTTLGVWVQQDGRDRAAGTLLLDATAPEVIRHSAPPPPCPDPDGCEPYDMGVTGRDIRIAQGAYTHDPAAPAGPPVLDAWVRFRDVPPEPCLHAGLLAQFTGHLSVAAALRPHVGIGESLAHRTLSMGINAIALSLHADVRVDQWLRYHHLSTFAGDGMTHSECRVYAEGGALVASFTVDAMVRPFAGGQPDDERKTI